LAAEHQLEKLAAPGELGHEGQHALARSNAVDLVDGGDRAATAAPDPLQDQLVLIGPLERLDHQDAQVGILERSRCGAVHGAVQGALAAAVQSRRIDEGDLRLRQRQDAEHAVPRGLGAWRDNAQLLTDERVEQCRLADVRAPDQGGESASRLECA